MNSARLSSRISNILSSQLFLIGIILIVSLIPRLWNLSVSPPIIVDEPATLRDINLILKDGLKITDFHWDFSKSRIVHTLPVLLIKLGIENQFLALRLSSVILSILSLIPFFLITQKLTNKGVAFATTLLFSFSYYFLQFSRVGWTCNIQNIFLGLTLFYVLIRIKELKKINIALSFLAGLIAATMFYGYRSGIILLIVSVIFLMIRKFDRRTIKSHLLSVAIYLLSFLMFSLPWINTVINNYERYSLRMRVVSVNNIEFPNPEFNSKKDFMISQTKATLSSWILLSKQHGTGDENPRLLPSGYPIVNWYIKLGFWIGLIFGVFSLKKTYPLYIIILMGLISQTLMVNPPNGARGLIMLPAIYMMFAFGINRLYELSNKSKLVLGAFVSLSVLFSLLDFEFYKYWMSWIQV